MSTKVYVNKCRWCGVVNESPEPLKTCKCCGAEDFAVSSYEVEGEFPKSYEEKKLDAAMFKSKRRKILLIACGAIGAAIIALGIVALLT